MSINRRDLIATCIAGGAFSTLVSPTFGIEPQIPPSNGGKPPRFGYETIIKRAQELSHIPFEPPSPLPDSLQKLDYDTWRDIRFRPERAFLNSAGSPFRLQLFHLGFLYQTPTTVHLVKDGISSPIPYSASLFDLGKTKIDTNQKPLPLNLGFAGFRLHYPLNDPRIFDELISFLGASYFRFLGRSQRYGLSARGLGINLGADPEEFPFFREFWIETPTFEAERVTLYALLDSPSLCGAYRFDIYPALATSLEVSATLFPRVSGLKLGLAPLSSMFFSGENERRMPGDYRPELHDSDGLLIHSGTGEWIWRPLRNTSRTEISAFKDQHMKGFGLFQRDRNFEHYQDLDLAYQDRPSYWIEPHEDWGEGHVELLELPTRDETNDNIVAAFVPSRPLEAHQPLSLHYRMSSVLDAPSLSPNGRVVGTYQTEARALGSSEPLLPGTKRFIIDFAGGDLKYYQASPHLVELVPSTRVGTILRSFLIPNSYTGGFRAGLDISLPTGQSTDLRAFLRSGTKTLTETWTFPWMAER